MKVLACFFCTLAIAASAAYAHDELPDSSLLEPMGNPINIGSFTVTQAELATEVLRLQPASAQCRRLAEEGVDPTEIALMLEPPSHARFPESTYMTKAALHCGGVDWRAATNLVRKRCDDMALERAAEGIAFPTVTAPSSYFSPDHHDTYHIGDGNLEGFCVFLTPVSDIENSTN